MKLKLIALLVIISLALLVYSQKVKPKTEPMCNEKASNAPCYVILTAVATDNKGAQTVSKPVTIHIVKRRR